MPEAVFHRPSAAFRAELQTDPDLDGYRVEIFGDDVLGLACAEHPPGQVVE
jgi:hypothetical protein